MPDVQRPFDSEEVSRGPAPGVPPRWAGRRGKRPHSLFDAIRRGFIGRCPACDRAKLFDAFLKPMQMCPSCGQDWSHQRADDFPPYIVILVLGHVLVPSMAAVETEFHPPIWVHLTLWLPLALLLGVGLLQPVKGAVIAYQWWCGMGGFRERQHPLRKSTTPPSTPI